MTSREDYARRHRIHLIIQPGLYVDEQPKYTLLLSIPVDKIMFSLGNYWLWKGASKMLFLCWDFTRSDVLPCQFNDSNLSKHWRWLSLERFLNPFGDVGILGNNFLHQMLLKTLLWTLIVPLHASVLHPVYVHFIKTRARIVVENNQHRGKRFCCLMYLLERRGLTS